MKATTDLGVWLEPHSITASAGREGWLWREDELLFAADPVAQAAPFADPRLELRRIDATTVAAHLGEDARRRLFAGAGAVHRAGLARGDILYAVCNPDGAVLHHSFVQFAPRIMRLLGEHAGVPLIGRCGTDSSARGQRLYPRTLRHIMAELAAAGHRRVAIYCDTINGASIRGIEHAGFTRVCRMHSLIAGDRWCLQLRTPGGLRLFRY